MIFPRGAKKTRLLPSYAATHDLNGMGEMTGVHALTEWGYTSSVRASLFLLLPMVIFISFDNKRQKNH
jgi:hypothetical protein